MLIFTPGMSAEINACTLPDSISHACQFRLGDKA